MASRTTPALDTRASSSSGGRMRESRDHAASADHARERHRDVAHARDLAGVPTLCTRALVAQERVREAREARPMP